MMSEASWPDCQTTKPQVCLQFSSERAGMLTLWVSHQRTVFVLFRLTNIMQFFLVFLLHSTKLNIYMSVYIFQLSSSLLSVACCWILLAQRHQQLFHFMALYVPCDLRDSGAWASSTQMLHVLTWILIMKQMNRTFAELTGLFNSSRNGLVSFVTLVFSASLDFTSLSESSQTSGRLVSSCSVWSGAECLSWLSRWFKDFMSDIFTNHSCDLFALSQFQVWIIVVIFYLPYFYSVSLFLGHKWTLLFIYVNEAMQVYDQIVFSFRSLQAFWWLHDSLLYKTLSNKKHLDKTIWQNCTRNLQKLAALVALMTLRWLH